MPTHIEKPSRIAAAGNKPKIIEEMVGRVNSEADTAKSIAAKILVASMIFSSFTWP